MKYIYVNVLTRLFLIKPSCIEMNKAGDKLHGGICFIGGRHDDYYKCLIHYMLYILAGGGGGGELFIKYVAMCKPDVNSVSNKNREKRKK